ncbi:MAG: GYDIA family GHMP kinase [Flavobacteriaceae bacterium]
MIQFYSHGKLLLTGEYMVLKGAQALAVPTKMGQSLTFESNDSKNLKWESWDHNHQLWFNATLNLSDFGIIDTDDKSVAQRLVQLLKIIRTHKKDFLGATGGKVMTRLEFDRQWGLGSSSTLISNLAQWSQVDPYILLRDSFGGSGYDIACANAKSPLVFKRDSLETSIEPCRFNPPFKSNLYFVYLNQKKNSREAINQFKQLKITPQQINQSSEFTQAMLKTDSLREFDEILYEHEKFTGRILGQQPVKERLFNDHNGAIKSLGAWGGDFVLATGNHNTPKYFKNKGFNTVIAYAEMLL